MILLARIALVFAAACTGEDTADGLQRAIELAQAGQAEAAWSAAESEPDPLRRAQARVFVRHHAGDLQGALAAARAGSAAHPQDPWLSERTAWIALTLRRAGPASAAVARLEQLAARLDEPDRSQWLEAAAKARADVESLAASQRRRDAAIRAARAVSGAAALGSIVLLLWLAFAPFRARQRMSSTPVDVTGSNRVDGGSQ